METSLTTDIILMEVQNMLLFVMTEIHNYAITLHPISIFLFLMVLLCIRNQNENYHKLTNMVRLCLNQTSDNKVINKNNNNDNVYYHIKRRKRNKKNKQEQEQV